jgi:hypothetical protein
MNSITLCKPKVLACEWEDEALSRFPLSTFLGFTNVEIFCSPNHLSIWTPTIDVHYFFLLNTVFQRKKSFKDLQNSTHWIFLKSIEIKTGDWIWRMSHTLLPKFSGFGCNAHYNTAWRFSSSSSLDSGVVHNRQRNTFLALVVEASRKVLRYQLMLAGPSEFLVSPL